MLTTIRRLALVSCVFLVWTPAAYAWSWPVQGPVLRPFSYSESDPYAAGQHRGVDIGADSAGEIVVTPAAGTISFAGTVPTNGRSVTIETADGYSVTLTHLGSTSVVKGARVAEADPIGTVGPSGTPELDGPYVHLGIRATTDPNGYVDPLGLLPPAAGSDADDTGSTTSQPPSTGTSSAPSVSKPATPAPRAPRAVTTAPRRVRAHGRQSVQEARSDAPTTRSRQRPVQAREDERPRTRRRASEPTSSIRRPVVEPAAPQPIGLGAGHATRPPMPVAHPRRRSSPVSGLVCNGAAALFALGAAFAAVRRRRHANTSPALSVQVVHLARPAGRRFSRAA